MWMAVSRGKQPFTLQSAILTFEHCILKWYWLFPQGKQPIPFQNAMFTTDHCNVLWELPKGDCKGQKQLRDTCVYQYLSNSPKWIAEVLINTCISQLFGGRGPWGKGDREGKGTARERGPRGTGDRDRARAPRRNCIYRLLEIWVHTCNLIS